MPECLYIGDRKVGKGYPTYIIAEIGINHNGEMDVVRKLIDVAVEAGCNAVKFQKRTPELCVPLEQQSVIRETPWGEMTYLAYRHRVELDIAQYEQIDQYCRKKHIAWFASCWDLPSVDFMRQFDPPCYKIASATLTDTNLLHHVRRNEQPIILSTGMSTMTEIREAVTVLSKGELLIAHTTSSYACSHDELNLRMIQALQAEFDFPVGYSGHEKNLLPSCIAVALGASFVERHITLDRRMWGSDQSASLEPDELKQLVLDIREVETALGDGVKRVYETERPIMAKLRNGRTSVPVKAD